VSASADQWLVEHPTYLSLVTLQSQPPWDNKCSAQVATSPTLVSCLVPLGVCRVFAYVCPADTVGPCCVVRVLEADACAGQQDA